MSEVNIHASCVLIGGAGAMFGAAPRDGILLLGESGSGKSSAVLRLLARGAVLVADDRTELFQHEGVVWARAPSGLAGLLEARGLGIVELAFASEARVALAVRLAPEAERHPERSFYEPPAPLSGRIPLVQLAADDAALPEKIVLAAAAFSNALFHGAHS
jgi:HPr kinase/phosphorylase